MQKMDNNQKKGKLYLSVVFYLIDFVVLMKPFFLPLLLLLSFRVW